MVVGDWGILLLPMFFENGREESEIVFVCGLECERKFLVLDFIQA